jgi:hypothetical protein
MGIWKSKRGYVSDAIADYLYEAIKKIGKHGSGEIWEDGEKMEDVPVPRIIDLADAIEFCTGGVLKVEIHPEAIYMAQNKVSALFSKNFNLIPNRGLP